MDTVRDVFVGLFLCAFLGLLGLGAVLAWKERELERRRAAWEARVREAAAAEAETQRMAEAAAAAAGLPPGAAHILANAPSIFAQHRRADAARREWLLGRCLDEHEGHRCLLPRGHERGEAPLLYHQSDSQRWPVVSSA